jgi:hypothetical protein
MWLLGLERSHLWFSGRSRQGWQPPAHSDLLNETANLEQKIDAAESLSQEDVAELYATLARLIEAKPEASALSENPFNQDRRPTELSTWLTARELLHQRRQRRRFFSTSMFGEPAWEMLLELFAQTPADKGMTVGRLISSADVPVSVGKRWIEYLERERMVFRDPDDSDDLETAIDLTREAEAKLASYIETIEAQTAWHNHLEDQRRTPHE